jgi:hypothetical protein
MQVIGRMPFVMPSLTSSLLRELKIILYGIHTNVLFLKCRLATNMRDAKTHENFERVDKGYVLDAAHAAKVSDASQHQRLVYVSVSSVSCSLPTIMVSFALVNSSTADTIAVAGTGSPLKVRRSKQGRVFVLSALQSRNRARAC